MQSIIIMFLNKEVYRDLLTDDEYNGVQHAYKAFLMGDKGESDPFLEVLGEAGTAVFDIRQIVGIIAVNKK